MNLGILKLKIQDFYRNIDREKIVIKTSFGYVAGAVGMYTNSRKNALHFDSSVTATLWAREHLNKDAYWVPECGAKWRR